MVTSNSEYFGKGAYTIVDAARLVRAPYTTVRGWVSREHGIIARKFNEKSLISFAELMEIHFVKMFMDEGVNPQVIHATAKAAARLFETDYPFAVKQFDTDGKTIFATLAKTSGEEMIEDLKRGQFVFQTIMRPFFKKLDYNRSEIARYWPLGKKGRVTLDPSRHFGQPIDYESGIPTKTLYQATKAGKGQSIKEVAKWFGVPERAVRAAVAFEKSLA